MIVEGFGTQTAVVGTEHTLHTNVAAKTYVLTVDTTNMANGDLVELRAKAKVLTAGVERLVYIVAYQHLQGRPVKVSVPIASPYSISFTLKQTAGTARAFDWNVVSL